ncbi:hypothetical protein SBADM41S_08570 [Streptomyces badius]
MKPGARIEVTRTDGSVAEFTVDDVQLVTRTRFDAQIEPRCAAFRRA